MDLVCWLLNLFGGLLRLVVIFIFCFMFFLKVFLREWIFSCFDLMCCLKLGGY